MTNYEIVENKNTKVLRGPDLNYVFNKRNGNMLTWGAEPKDDPDYSKIGPFIADIEITTACNGIDGVVCPFCYKGNCPKGKYMTLERFKEVFKCVNKNHQLTQIAFGCDSQCKTNPDTFAIMDYTREQGVIPNVTVAQIDQETAEKLAKVCGAVAVSHYAHNPNACYDSIDLLTKAGCKNINIHQLVAEETYESILELLDKVENKDPRLANLNAIVFLALKQKGRGIGFHRLSDEKFEEVVKKCIDLGIGYGFDSCSSARYMKLANKLGIAEEVKNYIEPCESSLFSTYISVDGEFFPCSFMEKVDEWKEGIMLTTETDFLKDVWYADKTVEFRKKLLTNKCKETGCRQCPVYNI